MKINSNAATRTGPYNEGARGPRGSIGRGTETIQWPKNPGPQPLVLSSVFMITVGRFSSKENRQDHLGSGGTPAAVLLPFSAVGKRKWPRIGQFFCQNCVLYARTNHEAVFLYALMPCGTPFLSAKKGEKEASGGNPLNPRVTLSIFSR